MVIGIPRETKTEEYRVGLIPSMVGLLTEKGHRVIVEKNAGSGSGFEDSDYASAGAEISSGPENIFRASDLLVKVKEPSLPEIDLIREGQIIFTFFHFSSDKNMTLKLLEKKSLCAAYELVEKNGSRPVLSPMSEIAGKLSVQLAMSLLEKEKGGKGVLLGGAEGAERGVVAVIGAGIAGGNAVKISLGAGARVIVSDIREDRLEAIKAEFPEAEVFLFERNLLRNILPSADAVIGAVLSPGKKAPVVLEEDDLHLMEKGSVLVDISIDEGGCFRTSRPTTHGAPSYVRDGIVHCCIPNLPGIVPKTSTLALSNTVFPYVEEIASYGEEAFERSDPLKNSLAIARGKILRDSIAKLFA